MVETAPRAPWSETETPRGERAKKRVTGGITTPDEKETNPEEDGKRSSHPTVWEGAPLQREHDIHHGGCHKNIEEG